MLVLSYIQRDELADSQTHLRISARLYDELVLYDKRLYDSYIRSAFFRRIAQYFTYSIGKMISQATNRPQLINGKYANYEMVATPIRDSSLNKIVVPADRLEKWTQSLLDPRQEINYSLREHIEKRKCTFDSGMMSTTYKLWNLALQTVIL